MSMAAPRVKFSNELETRITLVDDEHWKAARVGPWETFAGDRARFKRRIELTEKIISWIFASPHRQKIFSEHKLTAINSEDTCNETSVTS